MNVDEEPIRSSSEALSNQEKLTNCLETVKAVRERCKNDQETLQQVTKEVDKMRKDSVNCTAKLKECSTQKDYLEFLKKGYDLVVQELETDAKKAKEGNEQCDTDLKEAVKGLIFDFCFISIVRAPSIESLIRGRLT